jgi:hypothetical protein
MAKVTIPPFPHRRNRDGTFDSICGQCFQTVATKATEAELHVAEKDHECKGLELPSKHSG